MDEINETGNGKCKTSYAKLCNETIITETNMYFLEQQKSTISIIFQICLIKDTRVTYWTKIFLDISGTCDTLRIVLHIAFVGKLICSKLC